MAHQAELPSGRARAAAPNGTGATRPPPRVSGGWPVIGHTVEFIRDTVGLLTRAHEECGEIAELKVAHRTMVVMTGPDAAEAFFRAPDEQLSPSEPYKIMVPVFGKDVAYDAHPKRMMEQLRMLLPALQDRRMRTYGRIIQEEVQKSVANWGEGGVIDVVEWAMVLTNFTSSHCLLGTEFRHEMTSEFAHVYNDLEAGVTPIADIHPYLPLPSFRRRDKARVRLVEMITGIVRTRREQGRVGEDFLQTLMEAEYKDGTTLTEHEITGLLLAAMFAGHHTSSVTTAWTLLELLQAPDYLARVLAELDEVLGEDGEVTYEALRAVPVLENAVKEALRLHPPLFMLLRGVRKPFIYKGYEVPVGRYLVTAPQVAHRMADVFDDPDRFDPDRFGPERDADKKKFAFIAFGGGRHRCMGNAFALLQVKTILAELLRRYRFQMVGAPPEPDFAGLVVGPKRPARVRYEKLHRVAKAKAKKAEGEGKGKASKAKAKAEARRTAAPFKIVVDTDLCQGHGVCMGESREVFRVDLGGALEVLDTTPDPAHRRKCEAAARHCPTGALRIEDLEATSQE